MAFTLTTLTGATTVDQNTIAVTSATGCTPGCFVQIDQETLQVQKSYVSGLTIPVLRGLDGTAAQVHPTSAQVKFFLGSDAALPSPQEVTGAPIGGNARVRLGYSAAGAITLPAPGNDMVAVLNGTGALAMTIANPTIDMDGCLLFIVGNGKAAHTVTYAAGLGNVGGTADVITFFATASQGFLLLACGGFWVNCGGVAGAATLAGPGIG